MVSGIAPGAVGVTRSDVTDVVLRCLHAVAPGTQPEMDTPFTGYGVDSLGMARLLLEIESELRVELSLEMLANCRCADDLVDRIMAAPRATEDTATAKVVVRPDPDHRYEPFPLTPLQEAYVVAKLVGGPNAVGALVYREFELPSVDVDRLRVAWQRVVDRHDMLRAVVTDEAQHVLPHGDGWSLRAAPPCATREGFVARRAEVRERMSHRGYEVGSWPLFDIEVSAQQDGPAIVHFSIDALVTDAHGLDVLLADWWHCYESPDDVADPNQPFTARDCVVALAERRGAADRQSDVDYWLGRLRNVPDGPDLGRPGTPQLTRAESTRPGSGGPIGARLDRPEWQALLVRAGAIGVSPTSLVIALLSEALAPVAGGDFSLLLTTSERMRLPAAAERLVGPFTSTLVFVVADASQSDWQAATGDLHKQLWSDLDHAAVSATEVLSQVGSPALPVVVTSLADGHGVGDGFARYQCYAVSNTSGVTLEHETSARDGGLDIHWDIVEQRCGVGVAELAFGRFVNALHHAAVADPDADRVQPLAELQESYYVARATRPASRRVPCQVYQSFRVADLDVARLERAWLRLVSAEPALRSRITVDGRCVISARAPEHWHIPDIDLTAAADPAAAGTATVAAFTSVPFALDRFPNAVLAVTRDGSPEATVHVVVDLAAVDGRSAHRLARELWRSYADGTPPRPRPAQPHRQSRSDPAASEHWRTRFAELPAGPIFSGNGAEPVRCRRIETTLAQWPELAERAQRHGVSPDAVVFTALIRTLAAATTDPFAVVIVRWPESALSWVPSAPELSVADCARAYDRVLAEDGQHDSVNGLAELRRSAKRRNSYPVVFTGLIDCTDLPLPSGVTEAGGLSCTPDVWLDCVPFLADGRLRIAWDIATDQPAMFGRLFDDFRRRLTALATHDAAWTGDTGIDPSRIPYEWNQTTRPYPADRPVHGLFEDQVRTNPGAVALRWRGGSRTYGELDRQANRIAWRLVDLGVGPGTVVGIALRRGPDMIAAVLGVLKAGGAYLPIEPHLPLPRVSAMVTDTGASIVLTAAGTLSWPAPDGLTVVDIDAHAADPRADRTAPQRSSVDELAYVIFTSGSTGTPKGVAVTHRPLRNLLNWCWRRFDFGPADIGLCVTSLGFDLSVFDIFGLLGCGASLYVADETEQKDPALLLDVLFDQHITFWNSAPLVLNQIAPLLAGSAGRPAADGLRLVFLSGDYVPLALPDTVRATFPGAQIVALGGATEATVWSNYFVVDDIAPEWRNIPYGRPIDNARYYILEPDLAPCPVDVEGDLFIGGECLSLGYAGRLDLTQERFRPDPFAVTAGGRMYRTGDRASFRPDGVIRFLGRSDNQVKVRGFRVELDEISHRLLAHPAVRDAVVLARADDSGDRFLVAYVVPAGAPPTVRELRAHCAATLPEYMVPNFLGFMAGLPVTANGKLDRGALPWPVPAEPSPPPAPSPQPMLLSGPSVTEVGDHLAATFARLLGVPAIDPDEDLWEQGVTSFTMVRASAELRRRYGVSVPLTALIEEPTVTAIARRLTGEPAAAPVIRTEALAPATAAAIEEPDFFSAEDRARFKASEAGLRPFSPDESLMPLAGPPPDAVSYRLRKVHRSFARGPVVRAAFERLLGSLRESGPGEQPRFRYPSAGSTYAVQVYVHVRPDGVDGVPAGLYYYRQREHALQLIERDAAVDRTIHFPYNRPIFDDAGFEIHLYGQRRGIQPLYGEASERYLAVEAGYLGGVLMAEQHATGIGLCPVGALADKGLRSRLRLDDGHVFLQSFLGGPLSASDSAAVTTTPTQLAEAAVVGLAGRFPGARDPGDLWRHLVAGDRLTGPCPARLGDGPVGGYLGDPEPFESLLFRVSPAEANLLDPQLKALLPVAWQCFEDSGHTPAEFGGSVGVFVGAMWHDHRHVGADEWQRTGRASIAASGAELANRISHLFGFNGPSMTVDTACSSSLTALHLAVRSLRAGECDAALVCGVNLIGHPYHLGLLTDLGLLGTRQPGAFAADADGWTPGEAVVAILLRRHTDAVRDADPVRGVIEGSWIGHAGGGSRFGMPSSAALSASLAAALASAGRTPADIDYVECAAAGAAVADAAEIEALGNALAGHGHPEPIPVGTVKPNVGHAEAAAGLVQLTKVLLQFEHGRIAPTLVGDSLSPLVSWATQPVRPADRALPLRAEPGQPLRALINTLGATGTYAHAIVRSDPHDQEATL